MYNNTKTKISQAYDYIKKHLGTETELKSMCQHCESYCGEKHNYEKCLNMPCFQFYLSYVYLEWNSSYEHNEFS